jgi:hypothetical protein
MALEVSAAHSADGGRVRLVKALADETTTQYRNVVLRRHCLRIHAEGAHSPH